MKASHALLAVLAYLTTTSVLGAQVRVIDLTGKPSRALSAELSSTSDGVELANGGFVFVDARDKAIRLAYLVGDSMVSLGRVGAGPGEFRQPVEARRDGKGGAFVPDLALARALMISPLGVVSGTPWTREEAGGTIPFAIRGIDPRGRLLIYGRAAGTTGPADSLQIQRWDPATGKTDVLGWWPMVSISYGPNRTLPDGRTSRDIIGPGLWTPRTAWAALPDGSIAIIRPDPYRIDVIEPTGQLQRGPVVKYSAVQVTKAERDATRRERGPMPDDLFPATLPPFEGTGGIFTSPRGEIWVDLMRAWNDSVPKYDVFDSKGVHIAQARLAPHSKVLGFGKDGVYVARVTPDDGLSYLEWYRYPGNEITRTGDGSKRGVL